MSKYLKIILSIISPVIITFISIWYVINFLSWEDFGAKDLLGSTLVTISGSDKISTLPTNLNTNFTALNTDKLERSDWFATTSATQLTALGTITTGTWNADTLTVAYGGTGSTTLTSNQLLMGNGTGAINSLSAGTAGQFLTASTTGNPPYWSTSAIDEAGNYTWTGNHTFTDLTSASSTLANVVITGTTNVSYPTASTSISSVGYVNSFNTANANNGTLISTTTETQFVTLGYQPSVIRVSAMAKSNDAQEVVFSEGGYSTNGGNDCAYRQFDNNGTQRSASYSNDYSLYLNAPNGGTAQSWVGSITVSSTGFTLSTTKTGAIGNAQIFWQALR